MPWFPFAPLEQPGLAVPVLRAADIVYGQVGDRELGLDLYRPDAAAAPLPAVVFIHGGGWHGGMKEDYGGLAARVAAQDYLCATVDYRLAPEAAFPAALQDCQCAVRWLRAHAGELGADPGRVAAWGHSAGGHLAALVALAPGRFAPTGGWEGYPEGVQCALCYSAPFHLATLGPDVTPAAGAFVGGEPDAQPELWERASPLCYLAAPAAVPFLVVHGDQDDLVPVDQADRFVAALRRVGSPVRYQRLSGLGHDLAQDSPALLDEALSFLSEVLGG